MVEHTVTIEHTFKADNGAEILVVIDQAAESIIIKYRPVARSETIELQPADLSKLAELFTEAAKMVS